MFTHKERLLIWHRQDCSIWNYGELLSCYWMIDCYSSIVVVSLTDIESRWLFLWYNRTRFVCWERRWRRVMTPRNSSSTVRTTIAVVASTVIKVKQRIYIRILFWQDFHVMRVTFRRGQPTCQLSRLFSSYCFWVSIENYNKQIDWCCLVHVI